jgi:hypothetical protein
MISSTLQISKLRLREVKDAVPELAQHRWGRGGVRTAVCDLWPSQFEHLHSVPWCLRSSGHRVRDCGHIEQEPRDCCFEGG